MFALKCFIQNYTFIFFTYTAHTVELHDRFQMNFIPTFSSLSLGCLLIVHHSFSKYLRDPFMNPVPVMSVSSESLHFLTVSVLLHGLYSMFRHFVAGFEKSCFTVTFQLRTVCHIVVICLFGFLMMMIMK